MGDDMPPTLSVEDAREGGRESDGWSAILL